MSFSQGVSGLKAANSNLDTIGNNISNSQTVGFKSGRAEFADIFAGAQNGLGVKVAGTSQSFSQGSLTNTERNLDLAIDGEGFFRLQNGDQTEYSRNGQFRQTNDGRIANANGAILTGYNVTNFNAANGEPAVQANGNPQPIQLPREPLNAKATTDAGLNASLNAGVSRVEGDFDSGDPDSFHWSTPTTVVDSLGNSHSINTYFSKTGENRWSVNAEMALGSEANVQRSLGQQADPDGLDLANFENADGNSPAEAGNGVYRFTDGEGNAYVARVANATTDGNGVWTGGSVSYTQQLQQANVSFDANGNLASVNGNTESTRINYALNSQNGSAPLNFDFNLAGSTQTAQSFSAGSPRQDGYASGDLTGFSIQGDGMIRGQYSNGQAVNLGQVALADFANEQGLASVGNNAWVETAASGQPALGTAGTGQLGGLLGSTLESSNVDLSQELVNMIVAQRSYQANAQTIKTQDQILQTAVNLR